MITLPKLVVTESDATTGVQSGKTGGDAAQDFLALLTGAMSGTQGQTTDSGAPLTLADLQAAVLSGKLAKGNLASATASGEETQTPAQKLADLLARQIAKADVTSGAESTTADMQKLFSGLTPAAKTDVLSALNKTAQSSDEKSDLSDNELAGLNALMAMLPHQQTAQLSTASSGKSTAVSTDDVAAAANRALNAGSLTNAADADLPRTGAKTDAAASATPFQVADDSQQASALAAASMAKKDNDNALQTTNTTVSVAPVTTSASAAQASTPVAAPVISAPLGSHEWQQNLSQHVTLFTRQGQQTAELRLHPEDLGQVQISIKLEDNQAQLQMVSAHSHVRQALEAALPTLRTSLAESGIQLGQSSISSESFTGQQQQQASQQQASRSGSGDMFGSDDDTALVTPASLQSVARGNGAVDIFA